MSNQTEHKQMHFYITYLKKQKEEEEEESNYMKEYKEGVEIDLEDE